MSQAARLRILLLISMIAALEIASRLAWINPISFPAPTQMLTGAIQIIQSGEYWVDMLLTLQAAILAIVIAAVGGFFVGILLFACPALRRIIDPVLLSYYAVPIFVLYPMLIVLLGINRLPLIAIGALFAIVAMAVNTLNGLERIPPVLLRTAKMLRMTTSRRLVKIILPATLPYLFTGLKLTVVYSFIAVIAGEFVLSGAGFGYRIAFAYNNFENQTMYGLMLILLLFVGSLNLLLYTAEQRLYQRRTLSKA